MKYQLFTIPLFDNADEMERLNRFLAEHRIIGVAKECVTQGTENYWRFAISYEGQLRLSLFTIRFRVRLV